MNKDITNVPELDNSISFLMGVSYKQFRTLANQQISEKFEITLEMLGMLCVLAHVGKIGQQKLAETLKRERSVTKRLVDNCIKRGLIKVYKSDLNKKARYLVLTEKGLKVKKDAHHCVKIIASNYYAPLTLEEQQTLRHLCKKLIQHPMIDTNSIS